MEELAVLFGLHPNTIHNWIKEGLRRMDSGYPYLFWGKEVADFIKERQQKNKHKLNLVEFYCCTCRAPRKAWDGVAELHYRTSKTANLKAICERCNTSLCKIVSHTKYLELETCFTLLALPLIQPFDNSANSETKGVSSHDPI